MPPSPGAPSVTAEGTPPTAAAPAGQFGPPGMQHRLPVELPPELAAQVRTGYEARPQLFFFSAGSDPKAAGLGVGIAVAGTMSKVMVRRPGFWVAPRVSLGADLSLLGDSADYIGHLVGGLLWQIPLGLGAEVGFGDTTSQGFSGYVLGLDWQPSLVFAWVDFKGGLDGNLGRFQLTLDKATLGTERQQNWRAALWAIAPFGQMPFFLGVSAGMLWN